MEPAACSNCSAKLRCAGVGLKSYLSSGKSSASAVSLRPIPFQESSTTFDSGSAGLTAASFFIVSWAWAANANASRKIARNVVLFISFSTLEFRESKLHCLISPTNQFRKNCGKLIEHLVPALELTTLFCVFHGLVSDEGQFRLAIAKVLKRDHVIGAIDGIMFYSIVACAFPYREGLHPERSMKSRYFAIKRHRWKSGRDIIAHRK